MRRRDDHHEGPGRSYVMENGRITLTHSAKRLLENPEVKTAYLGM